MGATLTFKKCLGCGLHYRMPSGARRCEPCRERHKKTVRETPDELRKRAARALTKQAIAEGKLSRACCETCGSADSQAHHVDYDDPLNIRWFCHACHMRHHAEERNRTAVARHHSNAEAR